MRDVPDWMQHLRRDRRGLPVPYINLWGDEAEERVDVRHDVHIGMRGVFVDDSAQTVPDFTRQNTGRQRECMTQGLCQVCARFVPWSRRTLVVADIAEELIVVDGRQVRSLVEPWLCERCATFAVDVCPALIRRTREEHLRIVQVPSKRHVALVVSNGWVEGRFEAETKAHPVAMWVKVVLDPVLLGA